MARHVDIIVPFIHNIDVRSYKRRLLSSCYRFIINMSFGTNLNYTNGTIIYNRKVLLTVEPVSKGFFYQAEMLIRLIRGGYLYAETPHFLSKRSHGQSKATSLMSLVNVIQDYLRLMINVHVKTQVGHTDKPLHENSVTRKRLSLIDSSETE